MDEVMYIGDVEITSYSVQEVYRNDHSIAYYGLNLWSNGSLIQRSYRELRFPFFMKGREENMIRKLFRTLLALLIAVSSFSGTGKTIVHAEDEEIPYSEDPTDIITELGTSYDVFPQTKPKMLLKAGGTSRLGERMGMIYINNQFGFDYLTLQTGSAGRMQIITSLQLSPTIWNCSVMNARNFWMT